MKCSVDIMKRTIVDEAKVLFSETFVNWQGWVV